VIRYCRRNLTRLGKGDSKPICGESRSNHKPTATDCCCRRHNSLRGIAAKFPVAPSPGTAAQLVRVYCCPQHFKAFPAKGDVHSGHSVYWGGNGKSGAAY